MGKADDYKARIAAIDAQVTELTKERRELRRLMQEAKREEKQEALLTTPCCLQCEHVVQGSSHYCCIAFPCYGQKGMAFTRVVNPTRDRSQCGGFKKRVGEIFRCDLNRIDFINELKKQKQ